MIGHLEIQWHKIKVFYEIKRFRFLVCACKVQLDLLVDCSQGVLGSLWQRPCVALLWDNRIWRLLISRGASRQLWIVGWYTVEVLNCAA